MTDEKQKYDSVRIYFRNPGDLETYKTFETILVVEGRDLMDFFTEFFINYVGESYILTIGDRTIVDSAELMSEYKKRFRKDLSRMQIKYRRTNKVWKEGEHYWSAPNGDMLKYRYDLEKCLATFEEK